ncbi:PadR family transcriptional regulator [candidate division KSB1 bacterium]
MKLLSRQEEIVLLSIWKLEEDAYGVTIREHISKLTGKYWSIGAIYVPLDRLIEKGFIEYYFKDFYNKKGGRKKRFYKVTQEGKGALEEILELQKSVWVGFPGYVTD